MGQVAVVDPNMVCRMPDGQAVPITTVSTWVPGNIGLSEDEVLHNDVGNPIQDQVASYDPRPATGPDQCGVGADVFGFSQGADGDEALHLDDLGPRRTEGGFQSCLV